MPAISPSPSSIAKQLRRFLDWLLALFSPAVETPLPELPEARVIQSNTGAPMPAAPPMLELPDDLVEPVDADAITPAVFDLPTTASALADNEAKRLTTLKAPLLIVDRYWLDDGGPKKPPSWESLVATQHSAGPPVIAAILKATQGTGYYNDAIAWFHKHWAALGKLLELRRGAYHYLNFGQSGIGQAAYYLRTVGIGSWKAPRTILPIVDVERGKEGGANYKASKQQIIDVTSDFIAYVKKETGLDSILYGRGAMRDLGITDKMGAKFLWNPSYTEVMKASTITRVGWQVSDVCMWQYTDGEWSKAKTTTGIVLPKTILGYGAGDTSVYTGGRSVADFDRQLVVAR